ncbi:MAG: RnfABCDGE type electron transport complex subunit G [Desulfuromonadaceae bacterium]|nr:RnfABCDGE type electron transport complex subunit G [Desulfuromonadaceae bacterium]MDD5106219.1 RnfABCDGE type electron transport complex subunit G [Desulfuromonadaceae bacterium]
MRDIFKLSLFLLVIAGISGAGLSYVNNLTGPLIEKQILKKKIDSFKEVYPQSDKVENESATWLKVPYDPALKEVNIAYRNGAPVGVIYVVETRGYSGPISAMVGFDIATTKITAIKVLSQRETPGLGAKAKESAFQDRYKNKNSTVPLEVSKTAPTKENQIQAITASTITSKAVTKGVNAARENFVANFSKGKQS